MATFPNYYRPYWLKYACEIEPEHEDQVRTQVSSDSNSQIFCHRFAKALTLRQELHPSFQAQSITKKKKKKTSSKSSRNCITTQRLRKRLFKQRNQLTQEKCELSEQILALQQQIDEMERQKLLDDSKILHWRMNRTSIAVDLTREYFSMFSQGYDSTNMHRCITNKTTEEFMYAVMEDSVVCREYIGIENFLQQWEIYTRFHEKIQVRLLEINLIEEEDRMISIKALGEMKLEISLETLQHLFPKVLQDIKNQEEETKIIQTLVGKEYILSFDKVLHFNAHGKVFAHESKVHLASGLLSLLQDPFAAVKLINAAAITEDGHWKTSIQELSMEINPMEKLLL
jgi:hypothetical protein